jgi:Mg2+ and Co2+ transporter CorA
MKVQKDVSARLRVLSQEFQAIETEIKNATQADMRSLQQFRQSLDDLRMTAWTVSELMNARSTEKDPEVVLSFLAAERLRRFSQMTRELSQDIDSEGFTWETSGIQSLFDSLNLLQARLSQMVAAHRAHYTTAVNERPKP